MSGLILGPRKPRGDKKSSNFAFLLQKKKGKNTAKVQRRVQPVFAGEAAWRPAPAARPRLWVPGASVGPRAVGLWLLPQSKCLMVAVGTGAQPRQGRRTGCVASSQGGCFLVLVEWLPVAVISSDSFPNSWETKSGLFLYAELINLMGDFLW